MEKIIRQFGLIGHPVSHSFSQKYFEEKFKNENIIDSKYDLFDLADINEFPKLVAGTPNLLGLNVTIPYKEKIIPFLDSLNPTTAARIGAVNTIKFYPDGSKVGFNTDYYGFRNSLMAWFDRMGVDEKGLKALVLGTGGASRAVKAVLEDLEIPFLMVSRTPEESEIGYQAVTSEVLKEYLLCINTTPLGMYPEVNSFPPIPYESLTSSNLLYDLVYNPSQTEFLKRGEKSGAKGVAGIDMLSLQAEKAWEIWQQDVRDLS